jgi:hypothetical protein
MFEKKNNQVQPSQGPQNLPGSNERLEQEKKLFGEVEESKNFNFTQPQAMISKEFVTKRRKFPFFLILAIIILGIIGFFVVQNIVLPSFQIKNTNQSTGQINNQSLLPEENSPLVAGPQIKDTDGDGLSDEEEMTLGTSINNTDSDQDGLFDYEEVKIYQTDPLKVDTDGDTYSDGIEVNAGYNPKDSTPGAKLLNILNQLENSQTNGQ